MKVEPVILKGNHVRLEPLTLGHTHALWEAAQHDDIWRYLPTLRPYKESEMQTIIEGALKFQEAGTQLPFAIISLESGKPIGSTRYLDIQPANRGIEIGWTWLARDYWRTPVNTECKYRLLRHAFEVLGAIRVQLKTDGRNHISQNAIERIGGVKEGVLRQNMILQSGYIRDSVYYSILEREWPEVKTRLEARMAAGK